MRIEVGRIEALFRYPVKSMRGETLESSALGWHGLEGDRRLALRRLDQRGSFPWLSAGKLPELVLFAPKWGKDTSGDGVPTHVVTPEGVEMSAFGEDLAAEVGRRYGSPVEMMHLRDGVFDDASISVITSDTIREICRVAGKGADVRRFRPNILVHSVRSVPFEENEWVSGVLTFGDAEDAPAVSVTVPDLRCSMVNIDPDRGDTNPEVLKVVARANQTNAGAYATVTRIGRLAVGQSIYLHTAEEPYQR